MTFGETVVRLRADVATGTDRYGAPIPGPDVGTPFDGAAFDPGGSLESVEVGRAPVVTTPKVYFRGYAPDIASTDRLRVRGLVYRVQGRPAVWRDPYAGNRTRGMVVELELVEDAPGVAGGYPVTYPATYGGA